MGRNRDRDIVNVEAQTSQSVGQQQTDNGNGGWSSLDLDAPHLQPRHRSETHRTRGTSSRRRSSTRPDIVVQSPVRDSASIANSSSVMPPRSQRRLNRSATAPVDERGRYTVEDDDREERHLALVRRHSERLESPQRARRPRRDSSSETELESESDSDVESDPSDESEDLGRVRNARDLRDMVEEADDEAPRHRRRHSDERDVPRSRNRAHSTSIDGDSLLSITDEELNHHRDLVIRGHHSPSQSDHELGPYSAPQPPNQRRSGKASAGSRPRRNSHRSHRGGERSSRAVHETSRSQKASTVTSSRSSSASVRRPTNVLSGFFKAPTPPKKHLRHAASGSAQKATRSHFTDRVECVICMCDVSLKKAAHLKCDHYMCNTCLKRAFVLSVEDSTHMPPKCCTKDHIQPKHVERLFDLQFKKAWNRKFVEYTTKNRLYCPAKRCGHFIKPSRIKGEKGRKYARCGHCDTKVCARCNNRWHKTVDCPQDQTIDDFLAQAKEEGWQRCYQCRAMVELREGCNHMTCRCGAEFCMICGTKWKGCDCPWFNDEAIAADRQRHMHEQLPPMRGGIDDVFQHGGPPMPPELQSMPGFGVAPLPIRPRPHLYQEESRVDVRQLHEREVAEAARQRIPVYGSLDQGYPPVTYDMRGGETVIGVSSASPHHLRYHYPRGSQSMISTSMPPLSSPYERASVTDYVSDVSRARGVREDSMERRLAERLAERPSAPPTAIHHAGESLNGQYSPGPPMYPYAGLPPNVPPHVLPSGGMNVPLMQSYSYSTPPISMDPHYSAVQTSSPTHLSMPSHESYEQRAVEMTSPRRRRRAHERERAAEAQRGRRLSMSAVAATTTEVKSSSLAGLTGPGRGMDRVAEWSYHVAPGKPASTAGDYR